MATSISLQEQTKEQLDEIVTAEGHTSQDSAIKSLIHYRQLYLQTQPDNDPSTPTNHPSQTHAAYLGMIGAGKTVTQKYHLHHTLNDNAGNDVIVIDPIEGYTTFTHQHNGTLLDGNTYAHLAHTDQFNDTPFDTREWARRVTIPYILDSTGEHSVTQPTLDADTLEDILDHAEANSEHTRYTLTDLIDGIADNAHLRELLADINTALEDPEFPVLQRTTTTEDLPTGRFLTLQPDTSAAHTSIEMLNATLQAYHIGATRENDVEIHIDQAHYLLSTPHGKQILTALLEHGPKHGVYLNVTTQTIGEFRVPGEHPGKLLDLFETIYLHRMDDITEEQRTALGLTSAEAAYIENARAGSRTEGDAQILARAGGKWRQRDIHIPDGLQMLLD